MSSALTRGAPAALALLVASAAHPVPPPPAAGTAATPAPEAAAVADATSAGDEVERRVEALLAGLSLEQKVGQLLFVGFGGKQVDKGGAIERLVKGKQVGGVALFARNVKSIPQVAAFTRQISDLMPDLPPFIAVDQEGGNVVRLVEPTTVLPSNMALGAAGDPALTRRAGATLGRDLWLLGFNMNLAPVLDVNSNPKNPVIGIRSFGEDPSLVGEHGAAYVEGLQSAHVSAVAKHFPGHGDTSSDSHYAMPALPHGRDRLLAVELLPFQQAADRGLDAVMTAHIALPAIEGAPDIPATVSEKVLTGLLRKELGFDGVIITDGLEMKGIVEAYGSGPAAVKAIESGADMVLILWTKEKKEEVHQALLGAVRSGKISEERLDRSVRRILRVKVRRGLFDHRPPPLDDALATLGDGAPGVDVANEIAERALTLVRGVAGLTPIDRKRFPKVAVVSGEADFTAAMRAAFPDAEIVDVGGSPKGKAKNKAMQAAEAATAGADVTVVGVVNRSHIAFVRRAATAKKPVVVVSMGSPYLLEDFPMVDAYLAAYSYRASAARAAALYLAGRSDAPGKLPVSLPGLYPKGHATVLEGTPAPEGETPTAP